jgi:hypothetical protein
VNTNRVRCRLRQEILPQGSRPAKCICGQKEKPLSDERGFLTMPAGFNLVVWRPASLGYGCCRVSSGAELNSIVVVAAEKVALAL